MSVPICSSFVSPNQISSGIVANSSGVTRSSMIRRVSRILAGATWIPSEGGLYCTKEVLTGSRPNSKNFCNSSREPERLLPQMKSV